MERAMTLLCRVLAAASLATCSAAHAISFQLDEDGEWAGVLNTTITLGAGWRMQERAANLVGKAYIDPDVCTRQYQSCQGLFRGQSYPSERLSLPRGSRRCAPTTATSTTTSTTCSRGSPRSRRI
jgi:hypothetical protein